MKDTLKSIGSFILGICIFIGAMLLLVMLITWHAPSCFQPGSNERERRKQGWRMIKCRNEVPCRAGLFLFRGEPIAKPVRQTTQNPKSEIRRVFFQLSPMKFWGCDSVERCGDSHNV